MKTVFEKQENKRVSDNVRDMLKHPAAIKRIRRELNKQSKAHYA